jgi:uncharacterized membrane protein
MWIARNREQPGYAAGGGGLPVSWRAKASKPRRQAWLSIVPGFVVMVVVVVLVLIDSNASAAAAADTGTYGCRIAAYADHRNGRYLADEDSIALGVGRHRMRVR